MSSFTIQKGTKRSQNKLQNKFCETLKCASILLDINIITSCITNTQMKKLCNKIRWIRAFNRPTLHWFSCHYNCYISGNISNNTFEKLERLWFLFFYYFLLSLFGYILQCNEDKICEQCLLKPIIFMGGIHTPMIFLRRSWGGGTPPFFSIFCLPKVAKLVNTNCREIRKTEISKMYRKRFEVHMYPRFWCHKMEQMSINIQTIQY